MFETIRADISRAKALEATDNAIRTVLPHLEAMGVVAACREGDVIGLLPHAQQLSRALLFEFALLSTPFGQSLLDLCNTIFLRAALPCCRESCRALRVSHPTHGPLAQLEAHLDRMNALLCRDGLPHSRAFLALDRLITRALVTVAGDFPDACRAVEWSDLRLAMDGLRARWDASSH